MHETGGEEEDAEDGRNDDGLSDAVTHVQPYEPKPPERSPAPAVFRAWRQDNYGTMMMQVHSQNVFCTWLSGLTKASLKNAALEGEGASSLSGLSVQG